MHTVLLIAFAVILAVLMLLCIPVRLCVSAGEGGNSAVLKWLFIKKNVSEISFDRSEDKKKPQKPKKTKKEAKKTRKKRAPRDWLDLVQRLLPKMFKPVARLLRMTSVAKVDFCMLVVGEDAAETAIRFGEINALAANAVALLDRTVRLRVKRVDIFPGFTEEKQRWRLLFEAKTYPLILLFSGIDVGRIFLCDMISQKKPQKPSE